MQRETPTAYTIQSLAERWQCSYAAIYDMIRAGKLLAFRIGRQYRITEEEVVNYERNKKHVVYIG